MGIESSIRELEAVTDDMIERFSPLSLVELNWRPSENSWSIAQILQHIERFNTSYFPIFAQVRANQFKPPFIASIPLLPRLFGALLLKSVSPDRRFKMKTFHIWKPGEGGQIDNCLDLFQRHQQELISEINATIQLTEVDTIITSPASKWVVYRLDTAIKLITTHEKRHYKQALEVLDLLSRASKS